MRDSQQAQPAAETPDNPENDPEILALLDFEPVPRKNLQPGGWTPAKQRAFLVRLGVHGSPRKAATEVGMDVTGVRKLYCSPLGGSFRAAWDGMVELVKRRMEEAQPEQLVSPGTTPPSVDNRRRPPSPGPSSARLSPGQSARFGPLKGEGVGGLRAPMPVVCDACAAAGIAGDERFSGIPDILAFDPVPVRLGPWDGEAQRAFIAALAATGSPARAAKSIGRHLIGAEKLRKGRGGRGFAEPPQRGGVRAPVRRRAGEGRRVPRPAQGRGRS